jgi:hypothetical protein
MMGVEEHARKKKEEKREYNNPYVFRHPDIQKEQHTTTAPKPQPQ